LKRILSALTKRTGNDEYKALQNEVEAKEKILRVWDCLEASIGVEGKNGKTKLSQKASDYVDLSDTDLAERIGETTGSAKYKIIRDYILEVGTISAGKWISLTAQRFTAIRLWKARLRRT